MVYPPITGSLRSSAVLRSRIAALAVALLGAVVAGCVGAVNPTTPIERTDETGAARPALDHDSSSRRPAVVAIRIVVPRHKRAGVRRPQFVSPSTRGITLSFEGPSPLNAAYGLTPSTNRGCSTAGDATTCVINVGLAPGRYAGSVSTYDQAPVNGKISGGANLLSTVSGVSFTVNKGVANQLKFTLEGVPASLTVLGAFDDPHVAGTQAGGYQLIGAQPHVFAVFALDADGNTIVGPGAPTISLTSSSSDLVVSPEGGDTNAFTVRARLFSASPLTLHASAAGTGVPTISKNVDISTIQELWVAGNIGGSNVGQVIGYSGVPPQALSGDVIGNGFENLQALTVDANGVLWVGDLDSVKAFAGTAKIEGDTITSGLSQPFGLAFDSTGNLWAANDTGPLTAYSGTSRIAQDTINGISGAGGLAFDGNGNLFVAAYGNSRIVAFSGTTQRETITTSVSDPTGVAFDSGCHLWVSNSGNSSVTEYFGVSQMSGNTITAGISQPSAIAVDGEDRLWIANSSSVNAYSGTSQLDGSISVEPSVRTTLALAPPNPPLSAGACPTPAPQPSSTPTPTPTATPASTPTPTPTATPTATPTPAVLGPTGSYYVSTIATGPATSGGEYARTHGQSGLIILDYGPPAELNNQYGSIIFPATFASIPQIEANAEAFLNGYYAASGDARLVLAIGTNNALCGANVPNQCTGGATEALTSQHGSAWAAMIDDIAVFAQTQGYQARGALIAGASDMEPGHAQCPPVGPDNFCATAQQSMNWLNDNLGNGFHAYNSGPSFVFFGSADGCPPIGTGTGCANGWTFYDLWYVAQGSGPSAPLPQIYYDYMYQQWYLESLWAVGAGHGAMQFAGALYGSAPNQPFSCPKDAFLALQTELGYNSLTRVSLTYQTQISDGGTISTCSNARRRARRS